MTGVSPLASVSPRASLGQNVTIGAFTVVHNDVVLGDRSTVDSHCVIGYPTPLAQGRPLVIGADTVIRTHCTLYAGSSFGSRLRVGHGVLIREGCVAGANLQVGSGSDIEGDCRLGDYVRTHSSVHISKGTVIEDFAWLFPRVQLTNDPLPPSTVECGVTIREMAIVGTAALLLPGVMIGVGAFVAAGSVVRADVPDVHCVAGDPATVFATLGQLVNPEHGLSYPWPKHFRRGYPDESYPAMDAAARRVEGLIAAARAARGHARPFSKP